MLWAQLNRNVFYPGNGSWGELFFEGFSFALKGQKFNNSRNDQVFISEIGSEKKDWEKSSPEVPSPVWFLSIYMREWNLLSSFLAIMMTLLVIITFSFFCIFFLSCCLVFGMGRLTFDFELIGGTAVVETSFLSSSRLRSLFTQPGLHICLLFILKFG